MTWLHFLLVIKILQIHLLTAYRKQTATANYLMQVLRALLANYSSQTGIEPVSLLALTTSDHSKRFFAPIFFIAKNLDSFFVGRNNMGLMVPGKPVGGSPQRRREYRCVILIKILRRFSVEPHSRSYLNFIANSLFEMYETLYLFLEGFYSRTVSQIWIIFFCKWPVSCECL